MVDQDGVVPKPAEDRTPPEGELGTILTYADSLFADFLDPTVGSIGFFEARDYQMMLRTESQARKVEQVLTLPLLSAPLEFHAAKGDRGEKEWVEDVLTQPANNGGMSTPLGTVIAQATTAVTYRVASFEKVWGRGDDNKLVYDKLAFRPAANTRVSRDRKSGAYRGLIQDPPYGGARPVEIPADRAWTYTHGVHRSPVLGSSDMEIPLVCWKAKQKLRFLWFLFLETHAQPRIAFSGNQEAGGTPEGAKSAAKMNARLRGGGGLALPMGIDANVLETGGHAADLFLAALKYLDGEMTGQVLAQFSDLAGAAASGTGSFALSRDQSDFYMLSRRYAANELGDSFTNFVVADLVRHNFGPKAAVPRFKLGPLVTPDLQAMLGALSSLDAAKVPSEFIDFIVEQTAQALGMDAGRIADLSAKMKAKAEEAATSPAQAKLAGVVAPIAAAEQVARKTLARQAA